MKGTPNTNESTVNDSDNDDSLIRLVVDDRKKEFLFYQPMLANTARSIPLPSA